MNLTALKTLVAINAGRYDACTSAQKARRTALVNKGLVSNMGGLIGYHLTPAGRDVLAAGAAILAKL